MTSSPKNTEKMAALGRMTRGLVHDFNNSLAAIMGYADFLTSDLPPNSEQYLFAENIKKAGLQLQEQIEQIRALSLEKGQGKDIVLDVAEDLKNIANGFKINLSPEQTISVTSEINEAILSIPAHQLRTLFSNIIKNAIESLEGEKGDITIHLSSNRDSLHKKTDYDFEKIVSTIEDEKLPVLKIDIIDTGAGMDATLLNLAIEPHFTTRVAETYHGMGLPVAHGIIKYLSGGLTLRSSPQKGTCVSILLPVEKLSTQPDKNTNLSSKQKNILLIEDREMVRHTVETILLRHGHTVQSIDNGYSALDILRENPKHFHVILTDYTMPEIDGASLITEIQTDFPNLPIIVMSGDDGHLKEIKNKFNNDHIFTLTKPVSQNDLNAVMAKI